MNLAMDIETAIGIALIGFFVWAIWRGGSKNPVGTGQLQSQLNTIGAHLRKVDQRVDGCAIKSDVEALRGEIKNMQATLASSAELVALEGQLAAVNMRIAGMEKLAERTDAGVQRIEGFFIENGVRGRLGG